MMVCGMKTEYLILKADVMRIQEFKQETEPEIFDAIKHGAILENVVLNKDNEVDFRYFYQKILNVISITTFS